MGIKIVKFSIKLLRNMDLKILNMKYWENF